MNSYKVIQAYSKSMKSTRLTTRGDVLGHVRFSSAKKYSVKSELLNALVDNVVLQALKKMFQVYGYSQLWIL